MEPFLFNLFNDKAIIHLPQPFRYLLAKLISKVRAKKACEIYQAMGGSSSIVPETIAQAELLEESLNHTAKNERYKVYSCMRYWHPRAAQVIDAVEEFMPDNLILLPLYPQLSGTTTASSFKEWDKEIKNSSLKEVPSRSICCFPSQPAFIQAHVDLIKPYYQEAEKYGAPRVLFSAHGLPEKQIKAGDPYARQVYLSVASIVKALSNLQDWRICYQSKVGPLKWLTPSTESEIEAAAREGVPVVIVPIAFVSEHSETKVELDIEYAELAKESGLKYYYRVPTLSSHPKFIECLHQLCVDWECPNYCQGKFSMCCANRSCL